MALSVMKVWKTGGLGGTGEGEEWKAEVGMRSPELEEAWKIGGPGDRVTWRGGD